MKSRQSRWDEPIGCARLTDDDRDRIRREALAELNEEMEPSELDVEDRLPAPAQSPPQQ